MGIMLSRRRYMGRGSALPYDAEIEYLDSNLSRVYRNYIDTGIIPYDNHTIRFVTSVMFNNKQRRAIISNYSNTSNKPSFSVELYVQSSTERLRTYSTPTGSAQNISNIATVSLPVDTYIDIDATIDFDEKKWYVTYEFNGDQYTFNGNVYNTTYRCVDSLLLFCDHRSDILAIAYPLKMKFMKIIVDNVLTRDYIPVRKGTTGYMYDNVSGKLFGNAGSGDFVLGPDKPYDELLTSLTIASGQTPAIITDYYPNNNTVVKCSAMLSVYPQTYNKVLCGTFQYVNGSVLYRYDIQYSIRGTNRLCLYMGGNPANGKVEIDNTFTLNTMSVYEFYNGSFIKDGNTYTGTSCGTYTCTYPLVLFSNCKNGTPSIIDTPTGGFVGTIYGSFDIYEGTTLMRSYHPAKKNGRVGLWESVTNQMLFSPYGEFSE